MTSQPSDFSYEQTRPASGSRPSLSIFANSAASRQELREDAEAAGFEVREAASLARLLEEDPAALAEVVIVDCPQVSERGADALVQLDERASRLGSQLVLSTSLGSLDQVFAACHRSEPQILVNSSRAGRVIVLGMIRADRGGSSVRELSDGDRLTLLRLSEQVGMLAERIDRFGDRAPARMLEGGGDDPAVAPTTQGTAQRASAEPPALPDPRLVRRIIAHRQARAKFLDSELFADPAWDMLLDLTAAKGEQARVSVTSLCIAANVPTTTALRWITQLTKAGLIERIEDEADRRRAFIALSDAAAEAMARYFTALEDRPGQPI